MKNFGVIHNKATKIYYFRKPAASSPEGIWLKVTPLLPLISLAPLYQKRPRKGLWSRYKINAEITIFRCYWKMEQGQQGWKLDGVWDQILGIDRSKPYSRYSYDNATMALLPRTTKIRNIGNCGSKKLTECMRKRDMLGAKVLSSRGFDIDRSSKVKNTTIKTYGDHRIACLFSAAKGTRRLLLRIRLHAKNIPWLFKRLLRSLYDKKILFGSALALAFSSNGYASEDWRKNKTEVE